MGLLSYIFLVYLNSSWFIKFTLYSFLFLFTYAVIIITLNYKKFKFYKQELLFFSNKFDKNITTMTYIYKLLYLENKNGLSRVFLSGLDKVIYLHKSGVNDIVIIINIIKDTMDTNMLKEIQQLKKKINLLLLISNILFFISISMSIINLFKFLQELNIIFYNELPLAIIFAGINEVIFQLIIGLILAFPINIVYHKQSNLMSSVLSDYIITANKLITLLYYKFHNLK